MDHMTCAHLLKGCRIGYGIPYIVVDVSIRTHPQVVSDHLRWVDRLDLVTVFRVVLLDILCNTSKGCI